MIRYVVVLIASAFLLQGCVYAETEIISEGVSLGDELVLVNPHGGEEGFVYLKKTENNSYDFISNSFKPEREVKFDRIGNNYYIAQFELLGKRQFVIFRRFKDKVIFVSDSVAKERKESRAVIEFRDRFKSGGDTYSFSSKAQMLEYAQEAYILIEKGEFLAIEMNLIDDLSDAWRAKVTALRQELEDKDALREAAEMKRQREKAERERIEAEELERKEAENLAAAREAARRNANACLKLVKSSYQQKIFVSNECRETLQIQVCLKTKADSALDVFKSIVGADSVFGHKVPTSFSCKMYRANYGPVTSFIFADALSSDLMKLLSNDAYRISAVRN